MTGYNSKAQDLSKHQWKHRIVLLISNENSNPDLQKQLNAFKNQHDELEERKLIVYRVTPHSYKTLNDEEWKKSSSLYDTYKNNDEAFKLVLIGLDGSTKTQKNHFLSCEDLFAIIDAMPMRQREIRKQ
ncbi:DUF4174 domain-containing protein [Flavobacteriaceae bacterium M23B6Z8]